MITPESFNITFSFPLGPAGPQIIKKSDWPGNGIVFSRPVFDAIRNYSLFNDPRNPLIKAPGVYILWERGEEYPCAYIGESENPSDRIYNHGRDEDKEFWTWAIIFGGDLNKAHIQYLEAELVALAEDAKRCKRVKANTPRKRDLGMGDTIKAEGFLRNMRLCLPIIGVNFFEKPRVPSKTPQISPKSISTEDQDSTPTTQRELFLTGSGGVDAKGYYSASEFVVLEGSKASKTGQSSLSKVPRVGEQRKELLQSGVWKDDGKTFVFTQDYAFNSPSRASSVCLGRTSNGWREWKDKNGLSLKELL